MPRSSLLAFREIRFVYSGQEYYGCPRQRGAPPRPSKGFYIYPLDSASHIHVHHRMLLIIWSLHTGGPRSGRRHCGLLQPRFPRPVLSSLSLEGESCQPAATPSAPLHALGGGGPERECALDGLELAPVPLAVQMVLVAPAESTAAFLRADGTEPSSSGRIRLPREVGRRS